MGVQLASIRGHHEEGKKPKKQEDHEYHKMFLEAQSHYCKMSQQNRTSMYLSITAIAGPAISLPHMYVEIIACCCCCLLPILYCTVVHMYCVVIGSSN